MKCVGIATRISLPVAMGLALAAHGQVLSHLTFEDQADGEVIDSISENGNLWFSFASMSSEYPVGSLLQPDPMTRPAGAPASVLSADFTPGFGYLEVEGDAFDLPGTGWTIEAMVRFSNVGGFQTILGRDKDILEDRTVLADLYFQKRSNNAFSCSYVAGFDANDAEIRVFVESQNHFAAVDTWYHMATVYDPNAQTLSMYVNGELDGVTSAPGNIVDLSDPFFQYWSVGRGSYQDAAVDAFNGQIDDLRITGAVLSPEDFLFVPPPPPCLADVNDDDVVDVMDEIDVITDIAMGCPDPLAPVMLLADDFSGGATALNGASADTGGTWSASDGWQADGQIASTQDGGALLPFDAQPNHIYTLTAEVTNSSSQWVAIGFCIDPLEAPGGVVQYNDRFSNELEGISWMLTRNDPARNDVEVFGGTRTANGLFGGDIAGLDFNSPVMYMIELNTMGDGSSMTAQYYVNGMPLLAEPAVLSIAVEDINYAGFSFDYGDGASVPVIGSFELTDVEVPACDADLNDDGDANMFDLIDYLKLFDEGCE